MGHIAIVNFVSGSKGQSRGGMKGVMRYTAQNKKTLWEGQHLVSGVNCQAESVYDDFLRTQLLHHKDSGRRFYHLVQSFPSGEAVDPLKAHLAARRLAEFFEDREVLVCTHTDRDHIHSHLIINAVALESGLKLHSDKALIQKLMQFNDQVCEEFQLPVFQPEQRKAVTKAVSNAEFHSAVKHESWKFQLMNVIDNCMRYAASKEDFLELMRSEGYALRWQDSRKYITYTTPEGRSCRDNRLHEMKYSKEMMELEFRIRETITKRYDRYAQGDESATYAGSTPAGSSIGGISHTRGMVESAELSGFPESSHGDADQLSETVKRVVNAVSDPDADGRSAGTDGASGVDSRTGWEEERATFLDFQNQSAEFSQHQLESIDDFDSHVAAGLFRGVVQLGQAVERIRSDAPVRDGTASQAHTDRKAMRKQRQKKIALGHAEDERTEQFDFQMNM